ncbi:MAG: iron-containing alcohol dehydrogenase [Comamonadaceae bacterium]|nr:iron-containing alcohol dehydrogenase [Comamonadaceae bacterium]
MLQSPQDATRFILYEAYVSGGGRAPRTSRPPITRAWRDTVADMMAEPRQRRALRRPVAERDSSVMTAFSIARLPRIEFGAGAIRKLPRDRGAVWQAACCWSTGARSFVELAQRARRCWPTLEAQRFIRRTGADRRRALAAAGGRHRCGSGTDADFEAVIGIGGGSVLDAAKAIAGLLTAGNSVLDHLEGVGPELPYRGPATPFIAVPTTAGTGCEATKNAVLSRARRRRLQEILPRRPAGGRSYAMRRSRSAGRLPAGADRRQRHGRVHPVARILCLHPRQSVHRRAGAVSGMQAVRDGLLAWYDGGDPAAAAREQHGLRRAAVGHLPGADRARLGAWPGLAAGRVLPDSARRGVRHAGGGGDRGQHRRRCRSASRTTRPWRSTPRSAGCCRGARPWRRCRRPRTHWLRTAQTTGRGAWRCRACPRSASRPATCRASWPTAAAPA